jgi:CDP-4-dehydro-6-deoxyglucose reductase
LSVPPGQNVLAAALAAGIALPYSCRAGRCATCKARLIDGVIEYPDGKLPPGIVATEAAKGEVLLCQARPRSDLRVLTRIPAAGAVHPKAAVAVDTVESQPTGVTRATFKFIGAASVLARPGQFVDVETAEDARERVPVVAQGAISLDVEMHELDPADIVRMSGPFDSPR